MIMHLRQRLFSVLVAIFAVSWLILLTGQTKADTQPSDLKIDKHALAATPEDEASLDSLAKYLAGPCKTERDKARAIFRWITDRIAYDADAYLAGSTDAKVEPVLKNRKALCGGYALLFVELGQRMGLNVVNVTGKIRRTAQGRHGWVAVQIKDNWQLIDPTFGAGELGNDKFAKRFRDYLFFTPPDKMLFTHLPDDPKWQLVKAPVSSEEFWRRPEVRVQLFELGISSNAIQSALADRKFREFVFVYAVPSAGISMIKGPVEKYLVEGRKYEFSFKSQDLTAMSIFNEKIVTPLSKKGDMFTATIKATKGTLLVAARKNKTGIDYSGMLGYVVESPAAGGAQRPTTQPSGPAKKE